MSVIKDENNNIVQVLDYNFVKKSALKTKKSRLCFFKRGFSL